MTSGKVIHFFLIRPDGTMTDINDLLTDDMLSRLVGGDYEAIQPPDKDITLFINEDGKRLGLNPNWLATQLAHPPLRPGDFIVGSAVVTGRPNKDGDVTSLPDSERKRIKDVHAERTR